MPDPNADVQPVDTDPEVDANLAEARAREAAIAAEIAKSEEEFRRTQESGVSAMVLKEQMRMASMGTVSLGRIVHYRSRTGNYSVPAIINCTLTDIYQPGVEGGHMPGIDSADRVHLTVFSAGLPGQRVDADDFVVTSDQPVSENLAGCYQEWNIPYDPDCGPGTWCWPPRV